MPPKVQWAFFLLLAATAGWIIEGIVILVYLSSAMGRRQILSNLSMSSSPELIDPVRVVTIVTFLVGAFLYIWLALKIRTGRGWARITATVLAALSIFDLDLSSIPCIIRFVLGIAAIVLIWLPENREYFRKLRPWNNHYSPSY